MMLDKMSLLSAYKKSLKSYQEQLGHRGHTEWYILRLLLNYVNINITSIQSMTVLS